MKVILFCISFLLLAPIEGLKDFYKEKKAKVIKYELIFRGIMIRILLILPLMVAFYAGNNKVQIPKKDKSFYYY